MELSELQKIRRQKADALRERGLNPYSPHSARTHTTADAIDRFKKLEAESTDPIEDQESITLAGRAMVLAKGGKKPDAEKLLARTKKALEGAQEGPPDTFVVAALAASALGDKAFAQAMAKAALKGGKLPEAAKKQLAAI